VKPGDLVELVRVRPEIGRPRSEWSRIPAARGLLIATYPGLMPYESRVVILDDINQEPTTYESGPGWQVCVLQEAE